MTDDRIVSTPLSPMLVVKDPIQTMEFYAEVFGGEELEKMRLTMPDGMVVHAEMYVGEGSLIMFSQEGSGPSPSAETLDGSPVILNLHVPDVDVTFEKAVAAGCTVEFPLSDQFYGHRTGRIVDPFGHVWILSTVTEPELTMTEMRARFDAMLDGREG